MENINWSRLTMDCPSVSRYHVFSFILSLGIINELMSMSTLAPFYLFSVRISNELGSGHPRAAKYSVIVTVVESLLIGIFFMAVVMATKNHFAVIFTDTKEMQQAVGKLAYLLGITMVLNSVQPVISGTNKTTQKQT